MSQGFFEDSTFVFKYEIYEASLRVKIQLNRRNLRAHILAVFSYAFVGKYLSSY